MFSALKKLFGRGDAPESTWPASTAPAVTPPPTPPSGFRRVPPGATADRGAAPPPIEARSQRPIPPSVSPADLAPARDVFAPAGPRPAGDAVRVPFQDIASSLPREIMLLVNPGVAGDFEFSAAVLVPQLASGTVKVVFSELRAAAPAGLFRGSPATGDMEISLPLAAIVPRIDSAKLSRRAPVKRWDAPPEINNLFGPKGAPIKPAEPFFEGSPAPSSGSPVATRSTPGASPRTAVPVTPTHGPSSAPTTPAAAPTAHSSTEHSLADALEIPLSQLAPLWPAAIIHEIRKLGVGGHPVHLPISIVEPALRSGKVCFTWQQIAAWIHPEPAAVSQATGGTLLDLPLKVIAPLFVARFRARENQKRVKVDQEIPDVFGNGAAAPVPLAAPAPVEQQATPAAPIETPAPIALAVVAPVVPPSEPEPLVFEQEPPSAPVPIKMPSMEMPAPKASAPPVTAEIPVPIVVPPIVAKEVTPPASRLGALFGEPNKTEWSPAEIVQKVSVLPGVSGAVIALAEGLPIAAQLPSTVNADAFAGFMPQMFARIAQYTRELKFGEINRLSLEVGGGQVIVFRAGRVYFGVVGEGTNSSTAQLALVATELSKLNQ
jgi:predicted regulator of Ras-like GTPase activity (Roadblock/LC7/MglB family)